MKATIRHAMGMQGAISVVEMIALYNTIAAQYPDVFWGGHALDLGSAYGKSSYVAIKALSTNLSTMRPTFTLCDPAFSDSIDKASVIEDVFSLGMSVYLTEKSSLEVIKNFDDIVYVFIDSGSHELPMIDEEILLLMPRMRKGGLVFFHDFGNQFIGPKLAYEKYTLPGIGFEPVPIDWPLCLDIMRQFGFSEKDNNTWHTFNHLDDPMFMACMRRI